MTKTKVTVGVKILSWVTGSVIYESDKETIKEAVVDANLRDADLRDANLRDADLCGADLRDANLRDADLCGADLRDANLRDADLCGANLCGANLEKLPVDYINQCSRDILFILEHLKSEVPGLRKALVEGRVDGSQYEGNCACLIGTLANEDGGMDKVCKGQDWSNANPTASEVEGICDKAKQEIKDLILDIVKESNLTLRKRIKEL